jgi:hypothetical protein
MKKFDEAMHSDTVFIMLLLLLVLLLLLSSALVLLYSHTEPQDPLSQLVHLTRTTLGIEDKKMNEKN